MTIALISQRNLSKNDTIPMYEKCRNRNIIIFASAVLNTYTILYIETITIQDYDQLYNLYTFAKFIHKIS